MSALEDELLDKFRRLDETAQRRVIAFTEHEATEHTFDWKQWYADVEALRRKMSREGQTFSNAAELIREIREERLDAIFNHRS